MSGQALFPFVLFFTCKFCFLSLEKKFPKVTPCVP